MIPSIRATLRKFLHNKTLAPSTISINGLRLRFAVIDGDSGDQLRSRFEAEIYEYIDKLPRNSVFYDLGASIGHFSLYAAARGLRTYAFEPDLKSFNALLLNKAENDLSNLTIFNVAIADGATRSGLLLSNSKKQRVGDHHKVLKVTDNSASQSILGQLDIQAVVETWSMDEATEIKGLPVPNYMKIDIDGSEVAFLKGSTKMLANPTLSGFIIELSKDSEYYAHILKVLEGFGFTPNQEYQIYSSVGLEPNLFNITFTRS